MSEIRFVERKKASKVLGVNNSTIHRRVKDKKVKVLKDEQVYVKVDGDFFKVEGSKVECIDILNMS